MNIPRRRVDGGVNDKLAGMKGEPWPWDAFVTVVEEGASAEQIGRHIAREFTAFAIKSSAANSKKEDKTGGSFKHRQEFGFRRVVSNGDDLKPLSYYLLEDDVVLLFKSIFGPPYNSKDDIMKEDELLEDFFGDADRGRHLIINTDWNIPQVEDEEGDEGRE